VQGQDEPGHQDTAQREEGYDSRRRHICRLDLEWMP
jgi:hypothetical protein